MKKAGSRCSFSRRCPFPAWAAAETSAALYLPILNRGGGPGGQSNASKQSPSTPPPTRAPSSAWRCRSASPSWQDRAPPGKSRKGSGSQAPGSPSRLRSHLPRHVPLPALPLGVFCCAVHPTFLGDSKLPPRPGHRAPTHRIAFAAPPCCLDGATLWPGEEEPPGPPGLCS